MSFTGEEGDVNDDHRESKQQEQDKLKEQGEKLVEVNLATQEGVLISTNLPLELREILVAFLQEFKDVFPWTYALMPGLDL